MNLTERLKVILRNRFTIDDSLSSAAKQFEQIRDSREQIEFIKKTFSNETYQYLSNDGENVVLCKSKNNQRALELRAAGNSLFEKKIQLFDALELYNQSICAAEVGSEHLAIGYANRSAVYFEWNMYDRCVENIQLAKAEDGFPQRLLEKLTKRENDCKRAMKMQTKKKQTVDIQFVPTLCGPAHPNVPFILDCLEIHRNNQFGRYVTTNRTIRPGQVLAIENGFLNEVKEHAKHQKCHNCLAENALSFIPCERCTSAMFCNVECRRKADKTYHQYECPIIDYARSVFSSIYLSSIITAIKTFTSFDSVNNLKCFLQEYQNIDVNPFTGYKYPSNVTPEQQILHQVLCLETNLTKRTGLFQVGAIASIGYQLLLRHTKFAELLQPDSVDRALLFELIFRYILILETNGHSLGTAEVYGSGIYPFVSMLSHSCAPNIFRIPFGTKLVLIAATTIKKGEQVVDCYGCVHTDYTLNERQQKLRDQYRFICECPACQNDYPQRTDLLNANLPTIITETDRKQIKEINKKYARDNIGRFANYLAKYDVIDGIPCAEICLTRQYLECFFVLLADNEPIKMKYRGYC